MRQGEDASGEVDRTAAAGDATPETQAVVSNNPPAPRRLLLLTVLLTSLFWVTGGGLLVMVWRQPRPVAFQIAPPPATATPLPTATALPTPTPAPLWVDVGGAVQVPGVYRLPPGSRVQDALAAAGGLRTDADLRAVSRVRVLGDGEKLYVPAQGETPTTAAEDGPVRAAAITVDQGAMRIDLNTATLEELDTLPGIGLKTAQAILDYRQANGQFKSVEDLLKVKGIGEATLAKIRDLVMVQGLP